MINRKIQGKRNRKAGQRFEAKVRADLESEGWIVDRWTNNVEWLQYASDGFDGKDNSNLRIGKLIPAKSRYGLRTTGFPDFVAFRVDYQVSAWSDAVMTALEGEHIYEIIGIECKSNGYLTKEEKEKCRWLLQQQIFSKILIASKGKKRGEIIYKEFK